MARGINSTIYLSSNEICSILEQEFQVLNGLCIKYKANFLAILVEWFLASNEFQCSCHEYLKHYQSSRKNSEVNFPQIIFLSFLHSRGMLLVRMIRAILV